MTDTKTIADYEADVKRPGKFEGEARYIPYFWDMFLDGMADKDDGRILTFNVTKEDKTLFPELNRRKAIKLYERDDGFVVEV